MEEHGTSWNNILDFLWVHFFFHMTPYSRINMGVHLRMSTIVGSSWDQPLSQRDDPWEPSSKALKPKGPQMMNIRMMFPFTMVCDSCKEYNYTGGDDEMGEKMIRWL